MTAPIVLGITIRSDGSAQVNRDLQSVSSNLDRTGKSAQNSSRMFAEMAGQLKTMFAVGSIAMMAKEVFDVNRHLQSMRASLSNAFDGVKNGAIAFSFADEFAEKYRMRVDDVTQSLITLKNLGLRPSEEALRSYGNMASAQAKPITQMIEAVADAATGEFERLKEFGIKASAENGKVAFTFQGITTAVGNSASEIEQYLISLGNTKFGTAMIDQADKVNGAVEGLGNTWTRFIDHILSDTQENAIGKWVTQASNAIHWLDVQLNGAITNADKLAEINSRLNTNQKSLNVHNANGMLGSLIDDLSGYDAQLKKNKIEADLKAREQLMQAMGAQKAAQDALAGATANGAAATQTSSNAIKDELKALNDQHQKLALSERDYELAKLNALGMSDAAKAQAMAIWDSNNALEAKQKTDKEAESSAKSLQTAYENAANSLGQSMASIGGHTKSEAMEYEVTAGSLKNLTEAKKLYLLQQAAEFDNKTLEKNAHEAAKSALDALIDKYNQLTMSARAYYETTLKTKDGMPLSDADAAPILAQYDKNAGVEGNQKSIDAARSSLESYNQTLADTIAKSSDLGATNAAIFDGALGGINVLNGAFDNMVKSLAANAKALDDLHKKQVENADFERKATTDEARRKNNGQYLVDLKTIADNKKRFALEEQYLNYETLKDSLAGIRQTSSAMGQMFAENSAARKAFNIVALAASVSERLADIAQLQVKAALAMLTQGQGDSYTAFARIAAMGAIVASILGAAQAGTFNFGGSGGPASPPTSPDTGTVLGDPTAKSESIDKTYQLLKDIHADEYAELRGINSGIASLSTGITDVITRLFQAGGLSTVNAGANGFKPNYGAIGSSTYAALNFANFGMGLDPVSKFLFNGIFGGKQTSTVTAQGISTNATSLNDVVSGGNLIGQQFANIETKTDGGWFGSDKYSYRTQYSALDSDTQKALNGVFKSMGQTMLGLADNLGMGLSDRVKNYIIPGLTVDLKGLDGEAAAKKLNGVLSTALDTMSTSVFGDRLGQYQQLGEGMLETAVRVVAEIAVVEDALAKSGLSITGDAIAISDGLAQAAGGLKEFQKQFDSYYQKFYTDAERNVFTQKQLAGQLSDVNLLLPATRDGYRHLVEALNINNAADQERYSLLIKLSGAADTYYSQVETAANAAQQVAEQQRSLDIQLMEASGRAIEALTAKRKDELAAMDASLRFSQQAVWALSAANKAIDDAMNVLKKSVSDQKALNNQAYQASIAANNLQKEAANDLLSSLKTVAANLKSALSSTVIESDAFTRQRRLSAQSVLASALSSAKAGGSLANYAGLDQALIDIAKPSEQLYTSFIDFARDQGRTGNVLAGLADHTQSQISVAEQTLAAIDAGTKSITDGFNAENNRLDALITAGQSQIDAINGTTVQVMTVNDAITNLANVMNVKLTTEAAIATAQKAEKAESAAKSTYDSAASIAAQSAAAEAAAIATAAKAVQDAQYAKNNANALSSWAPAPTTWQNGQSGNAIWEQILGNYNASHMARYGIAMNRPWTADGDAQRQYQALVGQYNANSAAAAAAAHATAVGLAGVAAASAALIPGYQATAAADQAAANQAAAAYATASAYATAAKNAVPGINSFEVGTNYVVDERWAKIHPGERIMPAADNRELMMRLSEPAPSNNSKLVTEIRRLNDVVAKLQSELEKITKNTGETKKNTGDTATVLKKCTLGGDKVRTTAV
jgi:hypothetical protein